MGKYVLKRTLMILVILFCSAVVVFTLMYLNPGDPATTMLGSEATPAVIAAKKAELGIDRPYIEQLMTYLVDTFIHFDLGVSWVYNVPVWSELCTRLPRTVIIGGFAMLLNVVVGTFLGIQAAVHEGKWQDSAIMAIAMVFISAPSFWVALMFILLFSLKLGWLPAFGIDSWKCYVLPVLCSSFSGIAMNARQARSAMLEVIRADYITTARAKGQKEKVIVKKHMLPNALMPIITNVGGALAMIVAGSAVIEMVFSIPGVGAYMLTGINSLDFPVVRGCVIFFATFTAVVMLLVDLAYAFIDPRIKAQYAKGKKVA